MLQKIPEASINFGHNDTVALMSYVFEQMFNASLNSLDLKFLISIVI